ncbi:MAG: hypothetical protein FWB98_01005 [Defluviitaleaceae bacterium]|nr:hypothetical protein [Defluviitaleaceae bacterium]
MSNEERISDLELRLNEFEKEKFQISQRYAGRMADLMKNPPRRYSELQAFIEMAKDEIISLGGTPK